MSNAPKYAVLPYDKFVKAVDRLADIPDLPQGVRADFDANVLLDAVVIRLQDPFAEAGLSAYANNIATFIECIDSQPNWRQNLMPKDLEVLDRLAQIRDYFFEMAQQARDAHHSKMPD